MTHIFSFRKRLRLAFMEQDWDFFAPFVSQQETHFTRNISHLYLKACQHGKTEFIQALFKHNNLDKHIYEKGLFLQIRSVEEKFLLSVITERPLQSLIPNFLIEACIHQKTDLQSHIMQTYSQHLSSEEALRLYFNKGQWDFVDQYWKLCVRQYNLYQNAMEAAGRDARIDWLDQLLPLLPHSTREDIVFEAICLAALKGHLTVIQKLYPYLHGSNPHYSQPIENAAKHGHLSIIQYWIDRYNITSSVLVNNLYRVFEEACLHQQTHVIDYFISTFSDQSYIFTGGIEACLKQRRFDLYHNIVNSIPLHDRLGLRTCLDAAIQAGDLAIIQDLIDIFLTDNPSSLQWDDVFKAACRYGHISVVEWVLEKMNGYCPSKIGMKLALEHQHAALFHYFLNHLHISNEDDFDHILESSIASCDKKIIQSVIEKHPPHPMLLKQLIIQALSLEYYDAAELLWKGTWPDELLESLHAHFLEKNEVQLKNQHEKSILQFLLNKRGEKSTYLPIYDICMLGKVEQINAFYQSATDDLKAMLSCSDGRLKLENIHAVLRLHQQQKKSIPSGLLSDIHREMLYQRVSFHDQKDKLHLIFECLDPKSNPEMLFYALEWNMEDWVDILLNHQSAQYDASQALYATVDQKNLAYLEKILPFANARDENSRCLRRAADRQWVEGMVLLMPHSDLTMLDEIDRNTDAYRQALAVYQKTLLNDTTPIILQGACARRL